MRLIFLALFFLFAACDDPSFYDTDMLKEGWAEEENLSSLEGEEACDGREICSITETFSLKQEETALDILFVLDVSSSMKKDLAKLGGALKSLLSQVKDFNWQMAFTTADHGDHVKVGGKVGQDPRPKDTGGKPHFGSLMPLEFRGKILNQNILKRSDESYDIIFHDTLTFNKGKNQCRIAPYCQGDHEQPLRALKAAIEREDNKNFFRKKAPFIAVIITNEDERSEDAENSTSAVEVKEAFESNFSKRKKFYGFGILVKDEDCFKKIKRRGHAVGYGQRISQLAQVTGGRNISICTDDYSQALRGVSKLIRQKVLDRVYLATARPDPDSVEIEMHPKQDVTWEAKGREIIFSSPLKKGTQMRITYNPQTL